MIHINKELTDPLISRAKNAARKRKNHNFHQNMEERVHRMIHASNPDTYVQPHKHENPDKIEAFILLKGRVVVIEFSETGAIIDHIVLDHKTANYGVEIPAKAWHTLITLEKDSLIYELKDGPWDPADDKNFAKWAPVEGSPHCGEYNKSTLQKLNLL